MSKKPETKPDNPEQSKRFEETARELGVDESGAAFYLLLDTVLPKPAAPASPAETPKRHDRSD